MGIFNPPTESLHTLKKILLFLEQFLLFLAPEIIEDSLKNIAWFNQNLLSLYI